VLIIDEETGEITIERLSQQIQVKKTRAEKSVQGDGGGMPLLPTPAAKTIPSMNNYRSRTPLGSPSGGSGSRHGSRANSPVQLPPSLSQTPHVALGEIETQRPPPVAPRPPSSQTVAAPLPSQQLTKGTGLSESSSSSSDNSSSDR